MTKILKTLKYIQWGYTYKERNIRNVSFLIPLIRNGSKKLFSVAKKDFVASLTICFVFSNFLEFVAYFLY